MRIRYKLLALLLAIALTPLLVTGWIGRRTSERLGTQLAGRTADILSANATDLLNKLIDDSAAIMLREQTLIQFAVRTQAREVERLVAGGAGGGIAVHALDAVRTADRAGVVYFDSDYDDPAREPAGMVESTRHFRRSADGGYTPVRITGAHQVLRLAPGVARDAVADDLGRIATLPTVYQFVNTAFPRLIHWQYTSLDNGLHSAYPGHGGYPADFDARRRDWYVRARDSDGVVSGPAFVDASTGDIVVSTSCAVHRPDGSFAGVTAIDVRLTDILDDVRLPPEWRGVARVGLGAIVATPVDANVVGGADKRLAMTARRSSDDAGDHHRSWDVPIEPDILTSSDAAGYNALVQDIRHGRSGVRSMPFEGKPAMWAHGPLRSDDQNRADGAAGRLDAAAPATLIAIVPMSVIQAQARAAEQTMLAQLDEQLRIVGVVLAIAMLVVILAALVGSRAVTRPVRALAQAARRIAEGDFDARVRLTSRDELGALGRTFDEMVPQLQDRLRMRESLALAMEVQQHLLPREPPQMAGLDIAGHSIYCDETGGDYYDFITLAELGERQLGVAVGDVTGHGIAAALLMTTCRALLRSHPAQPGELAELMNTINRRLSADTPDDRLITLFYLLIDAASRTLHWVGSGHDAAITYDPATQEFAELAGTDIPLGIEPDWQYHEYSSDHWRPGMVIVIGTDGIWEARNPRDSMYGKDRLRELIRMHADASAADIAEAVTESLVVYRQSRAQEDDVTLVVVKILD